MVPFRPIFRLVLTGDEVVQDTVIRAWRPSGDAAGFRPGLVAEALPDGGLVYTDSSAYAIKVASRDGELTRLLTRPFRPEPVTDRIEEQEIERQLEELEERSAGAESGNRMAAMQAQFAQMRRARVQSMEFYHEVPVVRTLRTSWEGTIWVRRRGEEPARRRADRPAEPGWPVPRHLPGGCHLDAAGLRSRRAGRLRGAG